MANENKNAPGSQGSGGPKGSQNQGPDPRQNINRNSGNQPHERPDYEEERPGYDIDVETEIPGGAGKSGVGSSTGNRPEMDDPSKSRTTRDVPGPEDERQANKRP